VGAVIKARVVLSTWPSEIDEKLVAVALACVGAIAEVSRKLEYAGPLRAMISCDVTGERVEFLLIKRSSPEA
jgi:hypothetical protein